MLFDIVIETSAVAVRMDQDICGVVTPLVNHKILLYTDDVFFTLQDPIKSLRAFIPLSGMFRCLRI